MIPLPPQSRGKTAERVGRTGNAGENLATRMDRLLSTLAVEVQRVLSPRVRALLLVGGYARGEGGVVEREGEMTPYNDVDLVVVVDRDARRTHAPLQALGRRFGTELGVDVDLWPLDAGKLEDPPRTLFWLDVALGGVKVLAGDERVLDAVRRLRPRDIPLEEMGRLLSNRAVGLALSNLERAPEDRTRPLRHVHKAVLAIGDALLLAADRYAPTIAERAEALQRLGAAPNIGPWLVAAYLDAARFRLRPDRWRPPEGMHDSQWYAVMTEDIGARHLVFEARRTGAPADPAAFVAWHGRLYPHLWDVRLGGTLVAPLSAALHGDAPLLPWKGHPRERLARVAVALAYAPRDPIARRRAAKLLGAACARKVREEDANADLSLRQALLALSRCGG